MYITESCTITCDIIMKNYSAPSSLAEMTSRLLLFSTAAFSLIRVTEILLKSWLVGSLSSQPLFLARASSSRLTTSVATRGKPLLEMCWFYMGIAQISLDPPLCQTGNCGKKCSKPFQKGASQRWRASLVQFVLKKT